MKKTYQNPEINIIIIQPAQMIAESLGFGEDVKSASSADARRGNRWGSDDDEY